MTAAPPVDLNEEISARESTIEYSSNLDKALGQQVNVISLKYLRSSLNTLQSLQAKLDATQAAYREAQNELELLKLKVLANKRFEWVQGISENGGVSIYTKFELEYF